MPLTNKGSWIAASLAAAGASAITLYTTVKQSALRKLWHDGDLKQAQKERLDAEMEIRRTQPPEMFGESRETRKQFAEVQKHWREKVDMVAQAKGVDTFSGAWQSLSSKARTKCVAFSAGAGVLVGAITRGLTNPKYAGRSGGTSGDGGDGGYWVNSSHHGHHHGHDGGFDGGGFD